MTTQMPIRGHLIYRDMDADILPHLLGGADGQIVLM